MHDFMIMIRCGDWGARRPVVHACFMIIILSWGGWGAARPAVVYACFMIINCWEVGGGPRPPVVHACYMMMIRWAVWGAAPLSRGSRMFYDHNNTLGGWGAAPPPEFMHVI